MNKYRYVYMWCCFQSTRFFHGFQQKPQRSDRSNFVCKSILVHEDGITKIRIFAYAYTKDINMMIVENGRAETVRKVSDV